MACAQADCAWFSQRKALRTIRTDVDKIAIGLGAKGNITVPGGSGKMFFDDIRLYRPEE